LDRPSPRKPHFSRRRGIPLCIALWLGISGCAEEPPATAGEIVGPARSAAAGAVAQRQAARSLDAPGERQILFGDLHVHSTFSVDAFFYSLPILGGEGAHPPADACDFARWCAGLDFFSINDHAEGLTPDLWRETKESIRQCNARAAPGEAPDLVAFLGFEWTQIGATPSDHYGHKNVIFPGTAEDEVPRRPISSAVAERASAPPAWIMQAGAAVAGLVLGEAYSGIADQLARIAAVPLCPDDVPVRELPDDCLESAATPADLFRKLDDWGFPALVIPHGLAWGSHVPASYDLESQLTPSQHDPSRQRLLEVMSGHGNSEEYRPEQDANDAAISAGVCPAPTPASLPCCWRAGELARERCGDLEPAACEERVAEAKRLALAAGSHAHRVLPDTEPEDWLDCDQCRDCFKPASFLRPRLTAQYGAAIANFSEPAPDGSPLRFRFGFIASSDIHNARAGTGYKQLQRQGMTDQRGPPSAEDEANLRRYVLRPPARDGEPVAYRPSRLRELFDSERNASFLYTGGLVAAHATGRDRDAVFQALERREVYGTSGPRMLLWFDLENGPDGRAPMGSAVVQRSVPRFTVRAAGAPVQQPGCPAEAEQALGPERLQSLCLGECHHPSDERQPVVAIEVVRIRPQQRPGEPVEGLIEDPWRRFRCPEGPDGCVISFEDPEYAAAGRDTVYYVRALQAPTPAINGGGLRTRFDEEGQPVAVAPCSGGYQTPAEDECLTPVRERAWSSPIYVDWSAPSDA
jgi:hypothetical protein